MGKTYEEIIELVGKTAEITKSNSESTSVMLMKLDNQEMLLGGLSRTVASIGSQMSGLGNEIEQLKLNEEVTTTQQETIIESAQKRVAEIIGHDPLDRKKYFKIFIQRLYRDARQCVGSKISRTHKGDFQRCIDYIEAWIPGCGCSELRTRADANAIARLEARRLGYNNSKNRD